MSNEPALSVRGLSKSFESVDALVEVDLDIFAGEVLGLVGDNGAGKSTFVNCIAGSYKVDAGEIYIHGKRQTDLNPQKARMAGLEVVHQHLSLVDTLDIPANFFLGREKLIDNPIMRAVGWLDRRHMRRFTSEALKELRVDPGSLDSTVRFLSGGQRQMVAVARAVTWGQRIVVMDEPAAALGVVQTKRVLDFVRVLADRGLAVIFISHNMQHVMKATDRIAVLRHGHIVGELLTANASAQRIVELITGSDLVVPGHDSIV